MLEILLAARGHRVTNDRLAELLWGDDRPRSVSGSLQTFVSMLRRRLAPGSDRGRELVVTEPEAYRVAIELVVLDLDCFDKLLERSAREPTRMARASLERALGLVRGDVLEDEPYTEWALELRRTYQARVLGARLDAADTALADHDYAPALVHIEAATALDRFSERAHRSEMLALYALGSAHEALARYRSFRMRLDDELGLEPSAETRAVESAILRQADVDPLLPRLLKRPRAAAASGALPLLGRATELDTLTQAVRRSTEGDLALIRIEGDAGLGKTRLLDELRRELRGVRAGRASCSELERHLPYVPLATALREALSDVEFDPQRLPALAEVLPELAHDAPGPKREFDAIEVLEALVAVVSQHGPFVLLIDDLQWADAQTLAALGYLQRRGAGLAAAVVTTALSIDGDPDDPLRRLSPDTLVRLEPLSADDLTPLRISGLHESTGGNPRFVAEAVASGRPACPSQTLAESLLAQARTEGPWSFRVLVAASVLEQPFEPEPLAELLSVDAAELAEELERLSERRLLRIDGFGFRFRYDLVRQVLLGSVSPARQRLLKQRLGFLETETVALPVDRAAR